MRFRSSPTVPAVGSLVLLAVLIAALGWRGSTTSGSADRPLIVYCAESGRVPMAAIAIDYENRIGRRVELRFGASETILTQATLINPIDPADLFLPADDYYIEQARGRDLIAEVFPLAEMRAVVLLAPGNAKGIAVWSDLLRDGTKVAVANPGAAIGKLTRDHLARTGKWLELLPHVVDAGSVTQAAAAAKLGGADAALVWDAVAVNYPGQTVLVLPEVEGVTARVEIAVLKQSADPAAARLLAEFVANPALGMSHFRAAGFRIRDRSGPGVAP